ncbi:MAG: hypothetical protein IJ681_04115 [Bacteroidales bacterium]|nr:hypothetical protein [Bacteroidales bacterium]
MKALVKIALCGGLLLCISGVKAQGYYNVTVRKQTDKIEALKNAKGSFQPLSDEEISRAIRNSPEFRAAELFTSEKLEADEYFNAGEYDVALEYYEDLLKKIYVWPYEYRDYVRRTINTKIKLCKRKLNKE